MHLNFNIFFISYIQNKYEENVNKSHKEIVEKGDLIKFNSVPFFDLIAKIDNISENNRMDVLLEVKVGYKKLKLSLKKQILIKYKC